MAERISNHDEQRLADRLKREAQATRPEFSEALHARIRQAIEQDAAPAPRPRLRLRSPRRWTWALAAAAVLAGVTLVAWWRARPHGPGPAPGPIGPQIAQIDEEPESIADPDLITGPAGDTVEQLGMLADAALTTGQWAYLDHDAGLAIRSLVDRLPLDVASIE
jgi:hypothetical protein